MQESKNQEDKNVSLSKAEADLVNTPSQACGIPPNPNSSIAARVKLFLWSERRSVPALLSVLCGTFVTQTYP